MPVRIGTVENVTLQFNIFVAAKIVPAYICTNYIFKAPYKVGASDILK